MAGLVPAINVDARDNPGHDDLVLMAIASTRRPKGDPQFAAMKMERPKPVR